MHYWGYNNEESFTNKIYLYDIWENFQHLYTYRGYPQHDPSTAVGLFSSKAVSWLFHNPLFSIFLWFNTIRWKRKYCKMMVLVHGHHDFSVFSYEVSNFCVVNSIFKHVSHLHIVTLNLITDPVLIM